MKKSERVKLSLIQGLVGEALSAYENDRAPNRAEAVMVPLRKAFTLCIDVLGNYPPVPAAAGEEA